MTIPEKVQKVFAENPHIKVVVDGETRYYRGLRAFAMDHPEKHTGRYGSYRSKGSGSEW